MSYKAQITGRHNPHAFRHGFARGALQNGADISTVAQLLGHSDVSITVRFYARWSDEELKAKHAAVSWLPEG
jgi:integrase/recombinase XerD